MANVQIMTDSTGDLPEGISQSLGIEVIPLYITLGESTYADGEDLSPDELFEKVELSGNFPKTASPSIMDFESRFAQCLKEDKDVVFVGLSSKLSATVQTARMAAEQLDPSRIFIIDSMSLSTGTGILAMEGARMAVQGMGAGEIADKLTTLRNRYHASMLIDTLSFLHKGGRCSTLKLYGANLLGIKPEVVLRDGFLVPAKLFRGSSLKAVRQYLTYLFSDLSRIDPTHIVISIAANPKDGVLKMVMDYIKSLNYFKEIYQVNAGCVISAHTGPGAVGILTRQKA